MPVNVVRTPDEEIAWEHAKAGAHEAYPDATGERFYRIVMAIYKKMAHYQPRSPRRPTTARHYWAQRELEGDGINRAQPDRS
jgi:hypothetical protein